MLDKPPRMRSPLALERARSGRCVFPGCGRRGCDPHHLPPPWRATRRSVDLVVSLCRIHHQQVQHTPEGIVWERENLSWLYAQALGNLGITDPDFWREVFLRALKEQDAQGQENPNP